jgi:predicted transposase/invertase (TIGR01784 family)
MNRRSLFHWGREYVKSLDAGDDYRKLPDVIAVNIVDFNFPPMRNYHTCFNLREDQERAVILTNSLEIHFINMVKYRKAFGLRRGRAPDSALWNDPLARWLAWFNTASPPKLISEVTKMDSAIQLADDRLAYLSGNEDERRAYELRFTALCDQTTERNHAIETGFVRGMKKGRAEKLEIARNFKKMGLAVSQIAEGTGLSSETIEQL